MEMATCGWKGGILLHGLESAKREHLFSPMACRAQIRLSTTSPASVAQGAKARASAPFPRWRALPSLSAAARPPPPASARETRPPPGHGRALALLRRGRGGSAHARERPQALRQSLHPAVPLAAWRTFHLLPGCSRQSPASSHSVGDAERADCAGRNSRSGVAPRALGGPRWYGREGRGRRSVCVAQTVAQGQGREGEAVSGPGEWRDLTAAGTEAAAAGKWRRREHNETRPVVGGSAGLGPVRAGRRWRAGSCMAAERGCAAPAGRSCRGPGADASGVGWRRSVPPSRCPGSAAPPPPRRPLAPTPGPQDRPGQLPRRWWGPHGWASLRPRSALSVSGAPPGSRAGASRGVWGPPTVSGESSGG